MVEGARFWANLRAPDVDAATAFYTEKLGLKLIERREIMSGHEELVLDAGGAVLCIEQGEAIPNPGTPVSFEVADIDAAVQDLRDRGVVFEEYDLPFLKTTGGIGTMGPYTSAWFKDPAGNTLAVFVRAPVAAAQEVAAHAT